LKPELKAAGVGNVNFAAVVHENLPGELEDFQKYWTEAPVYLDKERSFYKAQGDRWLGLIQGMMTPRVWSNVNRAKEAKIKGNLKGEGRLLGGVLVVGNKDQGVLYEGREEVWGDHADLKKVVEACKKIQQ